jgi:hypothetical protein
VQFPLLEAFDDESPRPRHIDFVGTAVSDTVTHDAPGSSITTAVAASTNDEDVVVAADRSTRAPRLAADDEALLLASMAGACRLRRLFDCGDCDAGNCGEFVHDLPILEIDWGCMLRRFSLTRKDIRYFPTDDVTLWYHAGHFGRRSSE